jgi:serine/threonine protein phosphatase PrpC
MDQHEIQDAGGKIDTCGRTHTGKVRAVNEDQFFVASLGKSLDLMHTSLEDVAAFDEVRRSKAYLFVVADGVGSVGGGQLASSTAVQALVKYISRTMGCFYGYDIESEHEFIEQLENSVQHAHESVLAEFSTKSKGPATTLTIAVMMWPRVYLIHVGDSRAYYLRNGRLLQITRDQTMGELMIDQGVMTEEQVARSSLTNVLASAVGSEMKPSVGLIDLEWGDDLLLCTDGLTRYVSDEEMTTILQDAPNAEVACDRLLDAALEGGGRDNITVVVGRAVPAEQ